MPVQIKQEIIDILKQCRVEDNLVFLPDIQLERKTYAAVNKCLEQTGGKWNRSKRGHLFESDPESIFSDMLETGEYIDIKKEYQFFETPNDIVQQMVQLSELNFHDSVLEPSAGKGAILHEIHYSCYLIAIELNKDNYAYLENEYKIDYNIDKIIEGDFLEYTPEGKFNKIIMNPPFRNQQDIDHFTHAFDNCLADGGIIVSIISESPFFRTTKKAEAFRKLLKDNNAEIIELHPGAFKSSGTMVKTRIVKIVK